MNKKYGLDMGIKERKCFSTISYKGRPKINWEDEMLSFLANRSSKHSAYSLKTYFNIQQIPEAHDDKNKKTLEHS